MLFDFADFRALAFQFAARFGGVIALAGFGAAFELARLALQHLHPLDGLANLVDQPLFLNGVELNVANQLRHFDARARQRMLRADIRTLLCSPRDFRQLRRLLQRQLVELGQLVERLQRLLSLVLDFLFGQLFVIKDDDFFDRARALAQILRHRDQFLNHHRRARDGLHHRQQPALDALGDGYFALARQQGHRAHFAQVHAHRVVGLLQRSGGKVEFAFRLLGAGYFGTVAFRGIAAFRCRRARQLRARRILIHFDPVALERGQQVVDFLRRRHFRRQNIIHLIVEQVAALLAHGDELPYLIVFFLNANRCQNFLQNP